MPLMHKKFTLLSREYLLILVFFIYLENLQAQVPTLVFEPVISSGLSSPVDIVNAGDGSNRIFIVQQGGTIPGTRQRP